MFVQLVMQSFRNLQRNKVYAFINIIGLAVSSAFIMLVAMYVQHTLSMDKFSEETNSVYRIELTDLWSQNEKKGEPGFFDKLAGTDQHNQLTTPVSLALDIKKDFPEVLEAGRFGNFWQPVIRVGNQSFKEKGTAVAQIDRNFFSMMGLQLLYGNSNNPFPDKYSVVISKRIADKYFGKSKPIGQTFTISEIGDALFTVSAVAKDFPKNSSLQFEIMTLVEADPGYDRMISNGTNSMSFITLLKLKAGTDLDLFNTKLNNYGQAYFKSFVESMQEFSDEKVIAPFQLTMRPFRQSHMNTSNPWPYYTDMKSLYQLILLAMIALSIAALNYVLLSLSRIAARTQETGVRKTLGAGWQQIVQLFLTETYLLVGISLIAGYLIAFFALPYFNVLANIQLQSYELFQWELLLSSLALGIILTLIAGIYPALQMAGINPLNMLGKFNTYKISPSLSRVFITIQYTACIALILFSVVIARQMNFVFNKDLGFDTEQVMLVENPFAYSNEQNSVALREKLRQYTSQQTSFTGFTGAGSRYGRSNMNGHVINGKREYIKAYRVDYNYFSFNKIPIIKGRDFSNTYPIDTIRQSFPAELLDTNSTRTMMNIVVNEKLFEMLGRPQLGEINRPLGSIIIGVCKDYIFDGLFKESGPMYHICYPNNDSYFWLKIAQGENISSVTEKLKTQWALFTNNEPFTFTFMDEDIKILYESHSRWMTIRANASNFV